MPVPSEKLKIDGSRVLALEYDDFYATATVHITDTREQNEKSQSENRSEEELRITIMNQVKIQIADGMLPTRSQRGHLASPVMNQIRKLQRSRIQANLHYLLPMDSKETTWNGTFFLRTRPIDYIIDTVAGTKLKRTNRLDTVWRDNTRQRNMADIWNLFWREWKVSKMITPPLRMGSARPPINFALATRTIVLVDGITWNYRHIKLLYHAEWIIVPHQPCRFRSYLYTIT